MSRLLILSLALCLVLSGLATGQPGTSKDIETSISRKQQEIQKGKKGLEQLTHEERRLFVDLSGLEKRIQTQEVALAGQMDLLADIRQRMDELSQRSRLLDAEQKQAKSELRSVLGRLWPLHIRNMTGAKTHDLGSWDRADRHLTWYTTIYRAVEKRLEGIRAKDLELSATLAEQNQTSQQALEQIEAIQAAKDDLLEKRLAFLDKVRSVRAQRLAKEDQLEQIRATIADLQYQLTTLTTSQFDRLQGSLPWPARGRMVSDFNPAVSPPRRGIGLSLAAGTPITAVSWGKVVHNDQLRGFGQVVILYHGDDYYSLYAFLADSSARIGQNVEKGEVLGKAGFYPAANGPGLYFELRFGAKPINPKTWLAALR